MGAKYFINCLYHLTLLKAGLSISIIVLRVKVQTERWLSYMSAPDSFVVQCQVDELSSGELPLEYMLHGV